MSNHLGWLFFLCQWTVTYRWKSLTSSNKLFSLNSLLWNKFHPSSWRTGACHPADSREGGDPAAPGQRPFTHKGMEESSVFPRPSFFLSCFKCWLFVLGLQRSFCLLQYCCFEQFCFSLSFREITSFGILTTNSGWEILFLITHL